MAQISARGSKGHHTFYLSVVESGTNIENNTSTVTINFWLVDDNNWYFDTWGSNLTYTVTVNGTTYSGNIPDHDTKTTDIITNQTQTITHNNDGAKQISFSFSTTDSTGAYYTPGTASASGTLDLTTLPRASTVTVNNQTIASASGNVSFSITSKADFYHKYRYTINGTTSSWLTAGRVNTTTTSFNIAYSTILAAMNNTNLSTLTVEVQTYNSSAYSTLVGTKSGAGNITVTLKPSAPTLTTLGFRSRSSGVNSKITTPTAGYTTVALTAWSHDTSSGASSYTTYFSVDQGASLQTTSATASNTVIETNTLPSSAKQYTLTYTAYTIDSRGNRSADATKDVTVYGYTTPLLTLTAYRTATNGSSDTTEDGAGLYSYVAFSNTLRGQTDANGALRSGNQNAIVSATCKYGSTSVTSGQHIALPETDTRTFVYTVQDRFTTTSTSVTVPQAKFPLDLYDDGHGNVGVGLGAIAEANVLKSNLIMKVNASSANVETKDTNNNGNCFIGWGTGHQNHGVYSYGYSPDGTSWTASGKWIAYRDGNGDITLNGNALTATRATNATYANWTETNPSSLTNYYLPFGAGYSTNTSNRGLLSNNGIWYRTRQGTASALGYSILNLGNTTASGTAGNKRGQLRLYADDSSYTDICSQTGGDGAIAYLPKIATDSYLQCSNSIWTGTILGGNSQLIDMSPYSRVRVYALTWGVQHVFEIDLADAGKAKSGEGLTDANWPWQGGSVVGHYDGSGASGTMQHYSVSCKVGSDKKSLWVSGIGYASTNGAYQNRNNDSKYYVYRVDGII